VVFTAVKAVLLQPLPYRQANRLVQIRSNSSRPGEPHDSYGDWVFWNDMQAVSRQNRTFESMGLYRYALFNLAGDQQAPPEALYGLKISASLFPTLGVEPLLGRNILPDEDQPGRDDVVILSYGLWTRRFNSDPKIVGQSFIFNGRASRIIGVMPQGFDFPMRLPTTVRTPSPHREFWAPLGVSPAEAERKVEAYGAVARLRPNVSLEQATTDLSVISAALEGEHPVANRGRTLSATMLRERTWGIARTGLPLLMAATVVFMLIGCANVANLLLARGLSRRREMAVRMALGASRARLRSQVLTESCVPAALGGLGGYVFAAIAWQVLPVVAPATIPRLASARADSAVLFFTVAVAVVNGLIFGLAQALRAATQDPGIALRDSSTSAVGSGSGNRLRSSLVVAEVALAVILVVIGGMLTGNFVRLLRTNPGFDAGRVLASIIITSGDQYREPGSRGRLFRGVLDAVRGMPGVEFAGTVDALPFSGENYGAGVVADSSQLLTAPTTAEVNTVSAGYLQTMGIPLVEGRWFRDDDMAVTRDAAIVNDLAARRLWPGKNALGQRVGIVWSAGRAPQWKQVVGVVESIHHAALDQPPGGAVYLSSGALDKAQFLVVRTRHATPELALAIRRAVAAIDPNQPVFLSASMSALIADSIADRRFVMTLLAVTGCLALLLSTAGVYGVVSYSTSRRTQEIGLRVALGATPQDVHALVFRQGMAIAGLGVGIGLASALALVRALRNVLAGLASYDPALIGVAVGLVATAAGLACWIPARRATRIDPMAALRQE